MKCAIKYPGGDWEYIDIEYSLEKIQDLVNGYIELVPNFHTEATIYCNEEGKLIDMPYNFSVTDQRNRKFDIIVGPVIMFGPTDEDGNETELTEELFERTKGYFND